MIKRLVVGKKVSKWIFSILSIIQIHFRTNKQTDRQTDKLMTRSSQYIFITLLKSRTISHICKLKQNIHTTWEISQHIRKVTLPNHISTTWEIPQQIRKVTLPNHMNTTWEIPQQIKKVTLPNHVNTTWEIPQQTRKVTLPNLLNNSLLI